METIPSPKDTVLIKDLVLKGNELHAIMPDSALIVYKKALSYSVPIHYYHGIVSSLMDMGACYYLKGQYARAKISFFQSLYFAKYARGSLPFIYNALGALYTALGIDDSAVYYYYAALDEFDKRKIKDSSIYVNIYGNLGGVFMDMKQEQQAAHYLDKAMWLAQHHFPETLPIIYGNIGNAYRHKGLFDSAKVYFNKAKALDLQKSNYLGVQQIYVDIGSMLIEQKEAQAALLYFDSAVKESKVNAGRISELQQGLGAAYLQQKDYTKALLCYKKALTLSNANGSVRDKVYIYPALAEIYDKTGAKGLAYQYMKDYADLKENLADEEKEKIINQTEVKYRVAEKDKEIATKQAQLIRSDAILKQKNWLIASGTGVVLFVIIISAILIQNNKRKQRLQIHAIEQAQEIDQLKASISGEEKERIRIARELHDGIMVQLSVVKMNLKTLPAPYKSLESTDYYQQLVQQMESATAELRQTAHNLMPDMLLQEGLAQAILYFCSMLRKNTGLQISFQPEGPELPRLQPEFELAVYRIVQELVQNILKHAQATKAIVQLLNYQNELLTITVEDNGVGFNTTANKNDGQGLNNIKTRIAVLGGSFDLQSDSDSGTTVHLEFELRNVYQSNNFTYGHNGNNS